MKINKPKKKKEKKINLLFRFIYLLFNIFIYLIKLFIIIIVVDKISFYFTSFFVLGNNN